MIRFTPTLYFSALRYTHDSCGHNIWAKTIDWNTQEGVVLLVTHSTSITVESIKRSQLGRNFKNLTLWLLVYRGEQNLGRLTKVMMIGRGDHQLPLHYEMVHYVTTISFLKICQKKICLAHF